MNKKIVSLSINIFFLVLACFSTGLFVIDLIAALSLANSISRAALIVFWIVAFVAFIPSALSLLFSTFFLGGKLKGATFIISFIGMACFIAIIVLMASLI